MACRTCAASPCSASSIGRPACTSSASAACTETGNRTPSWPISSYRRSEEHTSELQSLMRISSAVFCLTKKTRRIRQQHTNVLRIRDRSYKHTIHEKSETNHTHTHAQL